MCTTYILAGGLDRSHPRYWERLAQFIDGKYEYAPRILSCWFSVPDERIEERVQAYQPVFTKYFPASEVVIADKKHFIEQISKVDIVYFHGGRTRQLLDAMEQYGDIEKELKGKFVIGSSAGANYLATTGISPSTGQIMHGSGLSSVSVVVHYGSRGFENLAFDKMFWDEAVRNVEGVSKERVTLLLPEGEFVAIHKEG